MIKTAQVVSTICSGCISCYRKNCPRGAWSKEKIVPIPLVGSDKICPLAKMDADQPESTAVLDAAATWQICGQCKYSSGGKISKKNYEKHCLDCPNFAIREGIIEAQMEARIS